MEKNLANIPTSRYYRIVQYNYIQVAHFQFKKKHSQHFD